MKVQLNSKINAIQEGQGERVAGCLGALGQVQCSRMEWKCISESCF